MDRNETIINVIRDPKLERKFFLNNGIRFLDYVEDTEEITTAVVEVAVKYGRREVIQALIRSQKTSPKVFMSALCALPKVTIGINYDCLMDGEFILRSAHRSMSAQILCRFKSASSEAFTDEERVSFEKYKKVALRFKQPLWYVALMGRMEDLEDFNMLLSMVETSFWKAFFFRKLYLPLNQYLQPTQDERIAFAAAGLKDRMETLIAQRESELEKYASRNDGLKVQLEILKKIKKKRISCIEQTVNVAISTIEEELKEVDVDSEDTFIEDPLPEEASFEEVEDSTAEEVPGDEEQETPADEVLDDTGTDEDEGSQEEIAARGSKILQEIKDV